jgi:hypothetical protein
LTHKNEKWFVVVLLVIFFVLALIVYFKLNEGETGK